MKKQIITSVNSEGIIENGPKYWMYNEESKSRMRKYWSVLLASSLESVNIPDGKQAQFHQG